MVVYVCGGGCVGRGVCVSVYACLCKCGFVCVVCVWTSGLVGMCVHAFVCLVCMSVCVFVGVCMRLGEWGFCVCDGGCTSRWVVVCACVYVLECVCVSVFVS